MPSDTAITLLCQGALSGRFGDAMAGLGQGSDSGVERLLRRARCIAIDDPAADTGASAVAAVVQTESPEERWWRACFGVAPEAGVGAYAASAPPVSGRSLSGWIIRPCSLHVGLDHLVLLPTAATALSDEESDALLEASRAWLSEEPIRIESISAGLWLLTELDPSRTRFDQMRGASSRQACGRNIDVWLPQGPSARGWRRLANELQMLWHQHPVNLRRSEAGLPVVNGLWFEGQALPLTQRPFDLVVSDDPVLSGLAAASGAQWLPASAFERALLDQPAGAVNRQPSRRLLIDPGCWTEAAQSEPDPLAWQAGWERFAHWFESFEARVRPGRSAAIEWRLTGKTQLVHLRLDRHSHLRFWRDRSPQRFFEPG